MATLPVPTSYIWILPTPGSNPSVQSAGLPMTSAAAAFAQGPPTRMEFTASISATSEASFVAPTSIFWMVTASPSPAADSVKEAPFEVMYTCGSLWDSGYLISKVCGELVGVSLWIQVPYEVYPYATLFSPLGVLRLSFVPF